MDHFICRYDIEQFAKDLGLDIQGIASLYAEYLLETKAQIEEAKTYILNNNWEMIKKIIHNIKGLSSNYRIYDVFKKAELLDLNLKNNITDTLHLDISTLEKLIILTEKDIKDAFSKCGITL